MEEYKIKYNAWLNDPAISEEDKQDLRNIQNDEKEIEDRFYKDLEFGHGWFKRCYWYWH